VNSFFATSDNEVRCPQPSLPRRSHIGNGLQGEDDYSENSDIDSSSSSDDDSDDEFDSDDEEEERSRHV
jgi:hypothetical protein